MTTRPTLDEYAMTLARAAATRSEDPYHQVGCALFRFDRTVISLGYNGAPPGVEIDWSGRDDRRLWVIHAEANALRYARPGEVMLMATTMLPCRECALAAAAYGVQKIVFEADLDPAVYDFTQTLRVTEACKIEVVRCP